MQSFYRRFVDVATRYPDHVAVELQPAISATSQDSSTPHPSSFLTASYTYAELRRVAEHLGACLQNRGISPGARCAILASNSPRWVAAYLGVMAAGCVAVLLYTPGTTSDPKGVMLTHGNLNAEADAVFKTIRVTPDDALLGVLPLFHALAQMANLLLPLSIGARVVYLETLNTTDLLRALQ